jgi:hypothetical protein
MMDVWRGRMSLRKAWVRITHLPRTSAFVKAVVPHAARWGETEHLLAELIDTTVAVNWHSKEGAPPPRYKRPGEAEKEASALEQRKARYDERQRRRAAQREKKRGGDVDD